MPTPFNKLADTASLSALWMNVRKGFGRVFGLETDQNGKRFIRMRAGDDEATLLGEIDVDEIAPPLDTELSDTSEKAVQNKVIKEAIDELKEPATQSADGLMSKEDKTKLDGIAEGAEQNVQSDWNQTNTAADDYIKNKPTIPAAYTLPGRIEAYRGSATKVANPNNCTESGWYYIEGDSSSPFKSIHNHTDYMLRVSSYSANWITQTAHDYYSSNLAYRGYNATSAAWTAWEVVPKKSDIPTAPDLSGYIKNTGSNPTCGNGTAITQPAGDAAISIRTTTGTSKDAGIIYLNQDACYVANSADSGYVFGVYDTDKTVAMNSLDDASFVVLQNWAGVQMKGTLNGHTIPSGAGTLALTRDIPAAYTINSPGSARKDFAGTSGTSGYIRIAVISVTSAYQNKPVYFDFTRRGDAGYTRIVVGFSNANNTDPTIAQFRALGCASAVYIHKASTSTWHLYVAKSESYDQVTVSNYMVGNNGPNVALDGTQVNTLPTGYITATYHSNLTSNAEPTKDSLHPITSGAVYSAIVGSLNANY